MEQNETIQAIMNRRSVRSYAVRPIRAPQKDTILAATLRAPTAGNMMLYSIIDVQNRGAKSRLAELCDHQPFIAKAPMVLLFLADMQKWIDLFRAGGVEELAGKEGRVFASPAEGDLLLSCCDALIAAQTSVIAAESLGIGSCYIGDIMENYEAIRDLFDLPPYTFPITLLCYGYAKSPPRGKPSSRCAVGDIVFVDTYRRKGAEELFAMHEPTVKRYFAGGKYTSGAVNFAQHLFLRKYSSDFVSEMNRSVREAMKHWKGDWEGDPASKV